MEEANVDTGACEDKPLVCEPVCDNRSAMSTNEDNCKELTNSEKHEVNLEDFSASSGINNVNGHQNASEFNLDDDTDIDNDDADAKNAEQKSQKDDTGDDTEKVEEHQADLNNDPSSENESNEIDSSSIQKQDYDFFLPDSNKAKSENEGAKKYKSSRSKKQTPKEPLMYYQSEHKWESVMKVLSCQRLEGKYCDVRFLVQNKDFYAHSSVLAANSAYFDNEFGGPQYMIANEQNIHIFPSENIQVAESLLDYMYTSFLGISMEITGEMMRVASVLGMMDALECCGMHLTKKLSSQNWLETKLLAIQYNLDSLITTVRNFALKNMKEISYSNDFLELCCGDIVSLVTESTIRRSQNLEHDLFRAICSWTCHKYEERAESFSELLKLLNPKALSSRFVLATLELPVFKDSEIADHQSLIELIGKVSLRENMSPGTTESSYLDYSSEEEYMPVSKRAKKSTAHMEYTNDYDEDYIPRVRERFQSGPTRGRKRGRPPGRPRKNNSVAKKSTAKRARALKTKVEVKIEPEDPDDDPSLNQEYDIDQGPDDYPEYPEMEKAGTEETNNWSLTTADMNIEIDTDQGLTPDKLLISGKKRQILRCPFEECTYETLYEKRLENHVEWHDGIKKEVCHICGDAFVTIKHLARHRKLHTGKGRQYACQWCAYISLRSDKLRDHIKNRHYNVALKLGLYEKTRGRPRKVQPPPSEVTSDIKETEEKEKKGPEGDEEKEKSNKENVEEPAQNADVKEGSEDVNSNKVNDVTKDGEESGEKIKANVNGEEIDKDDNDDIDDIDDIDLDPEKMAKLISYGIVPKKARKYTMTRRSRTKKLAGRKAGVLATPLLGDNQQLPKRSRGRPSSIVNDGDKILCPKCPKEFTTINEMRHHLRGHGSDQPMLCEICGFTTKHYCAMKIHMNVHSGDVLKCTWEGCTYETARRPLMRDHMNRHNGIKNHICSVCGKAFIARKHMQRHEKTHSEYKPIACSVCEFRTTRNDKLREHLRVHHPETALSLGLLTAEELKKKLDRKATLESTKPLTCKQCPQRFATELKLTDHMKRKHHEIAISTGLMNEQEWLIIQQQGLQKEKKPKKKKVPTATLR